MADQPEVKDEISEDELDQIIQDMSKEDEEEEPAPKAAPVLEAVQVKSKPAESLPAQALTLEMNGVINLKLCFKNGDRSIEVTCTEDALVCRMADGTEFRMPIGASGKARNAA